MADWGVAVPFRLSSQDMVTVRRGGAVAGAGSSEGTGRVSSKGGRGGGGGGGRGRRGGGVPQSPMTPQPTSNVTMTCNECGKSTGADAGAVECDCCKSAWKCLDCFGVSAAVLDQLVSGAGGELKWLCRQCQDGMIRYASASSSETSASTNMGMDRVLAMLEKILERQENIESKLNSKCEKELGNDLVAKTSTLQDRITKMEIDLEGRLVRLEQRMEQIGPDMVVDIDRRVKSVEEKTEIHTIMSEVINGGALKGQFDDEVVESRVEKIVAQRMEQDKDIEQRKCNIVIFGYKEEAEMADRLRDDTEMIHRLYRELTGTELLKNGVTKMIRLGRKELKGKERPLLITFDSIATKSLMMANLVKLKEVRSSYGNISVTHDLSPRQREEIKKVLDEASLKYGGLKGKNGQENWKVIVVGQGSKPRAIQVKTK